MERWQNKVAVVTGASSGIGAAVVKDLVNAGLIVVGLARRVQRVEELKEQVAAGKQQNLHARQCDVSNEDSVNEAFDWIEKNLGGIDILVNNAGIYRAGNLCEQETNLVQEVLQTNVMGVVYCTKRALKSMKARSFSGHVLIVNSVAGHRVFNTGILKMPSTNIYSPSKFAVTAMTEIYRQEFNNLETKVKITSISPGLVATEIVPEQYKEMMSNHILQSEDISNAVLFAISTPPHVQIHELTIKPVGEIF
ncbi:farnesol dehydrogenase-like [Teleopsis dalmanni]|uniref:farnesol dehydrogenase-like n=1 Tax=Teleopsis dalmanni TaxID=139649 RepID=UPI0018CFE0F2|nr:farnesol dehydrogenase-like [Teleopsis dalmanni]